MSSRTEAHNTGSASGFRMAERRLYSYRAASARSDAGSTEARSAPSRPPAGLDAGQTEQRQAGEGREYEKSDLVAAGELFGKAEAGRKVETADAAGRADQPGHHPDF